MKILFVTRKFPPSVGGMQLFARDLSGALATKTDLKLIKWGGSGRFKAVLLALPYLFGRSLWVLVRGGVDVVHAHDGLLAPQNLLLARLFHKPFVVVIHGLDITYKKLLFRIVVPAAVRRADRVICISQAAAEACQAARVAPSKIQVIPLAVNDDIYGLSNRSELLGLLNLPADSQILLSVGRLVKRKGVAWFVTNVLPALVKQHPKLVYLVAGDGEERQNIEAAIASNRLEGHVRLLGKTGPDTLAAAYNGADVFVMPNIRVPGDMEGFGLVLLEAALCARPVVAAGFEGITDAVVDGQNGLLVEPGDAAGFTTAISKFLNEHSYAREFGQRSRAYTLENYSWDKVAAEYLALYRSLL